MRLGAWLGVLALRLLEPALAWAEETPSRDAMTMATSLPELRLVMIEGGALKPPASLEARILSWFSTDSVRLSATRSAQLDAAQVLRGPDALGVALWVLPRSRSQVRLFFALRDGNEGKVRYLMSDVPLENGFDELGLEQVSQVAYLSTKALWEGRAESTRSEVEQGLAETRGAETLAPEPEPDPVRAPAPSQPAAGGAEPTATVALHTGAFYGVRGRGDEGVAHGPGASFAVVGRRASRMLGAKLRAQLLLPGRVERQQLELELRGYALTVGPWFARRVADRVWLSAELGAGADVVRFAARAYDGSGWKTSAPKWELRPVLAAGVGVHAELGLVRVGAVAQLTMQLLKTRYDVNEPSGSSALFEPWLLQPGAAVELTW